MALSFPFFDFVRGIGQRTAASELAVLLEI